MAEAAVLAALASADAKIAAGAERHDSLVQTKAPLKTIEDALLACAKEFKSDRFWADLAKPIDKAIEKFREEETALESSDFNVAAEARKIAMMCLEHLDDQMQQASDGGLFHNEARMVKLVHDVFKWDETLRLNSPLDNFAQATHAMQSEGVKERQYHAAKNQSKLDAVKSAMKPYIFDHTSDSCEMTVRVGVPPATAARDVKCRLTRETIVVSVAGHMLQPTVIDGKLQHPIDAEACDWHLEGTGDARQLVIDLEKCSGGIDWQDLLQLGSATGGGQLV